MTYLRGRIKEDKTILSRALVVVVKVDDVATDVVRTRSCRESVANVMMVALSHYLVRLSFLRLLTTNQSRTVELLRFVWCYG